MRRILSLVLAALLAPSFAVARAAPGAKAAQVRARQWVPVYSTNADLLRSMVVNNTFPALNLRALARRWIPPDAEFVARMQVRRLRYARSPGAVFGVTPGYEEPVRAASQELLDDLVQTLVTHHPDHYQQRGTRVHDLTSGFEVDLADPTVHPLAKAGLLAEDDLTVSLPGEDGAYRMVAGFIATPTHWRLHSFLGRTIDYIHARVPGYQDRLKKTLERILPNLGIAKDRIRNNWFIETEHALAMPSGRPSRAVGGRFTRRNVGDKVVLRSEFETLFRLPNNPAAMIFTIRAHVWTLRFLKEHAPETAWKIGDGIRAEGSEYEGLPWFRPVLEYFSDLPAPAPPPETPPPSPGPG